MVNALAQDKRDLLEEADRQRVFDRLIDEELLQLGTTTPMAAGPSTTARGGVKEGKIQRPLGRH